MKVRWQWKCAGAVLALTGVALAGVAAGVCREAAQAGRRHPPTGKFLTVDGVRLHFIDSGGTDPVVVLLHGNGGMIADMETSGLVDQLARRHRVIVFDRPGYGHSSRPRRMAWTPEAQARLLHQALARLGIERPIVLGHSWGAMVAAALALEYGNQVGGLVLVSGFYFPERRADVAVFSIPSVPVLGDLLRYTVAPALGRRMAPAGIRKLFAPMPPTPQFTAGFPLDLALRPEQIRASAEEAALMVPAAARLQRRYQELTVPVAILAGAEDALVRPADHSVRLHGMLPHSSLQLVPAVGHMLHHSATATVVDAVLRLGERAAPPRG